MRVLSCAIISGLFFVFGCEKKLPIESNPESGDVQLDPPAAGHGIQIGVPAFEIAKGEERQRNYFFALPSNDDVYINRIQFAYNVGSHHCNVFKSDSVTMSEGSFEDTFASVNYEKWDMVFASQRDTLTWQLPPGVAIKLKGRQQMCIQTHYVNASTQATPTSRGKVLINLWTIPKDSMKNLVGLVFASNKLINIPPHSGHTVQKLVKQIPWDINILSLTGHFHSRGKNFWVDDVNRGTEIYRNTTWDEPPVKIFPGAGYYFPKNFVLNYHSEYYNSSNDTIRFGPHVENEEHSNLFMLFYPAPSDGRTIYDIDNGW